MIGFGTGLGVEALKYLGVKLNNHFMGRKIAKTKIVTFNYDILIRNLEVLTGNNLIDAYLSELSKLEDNTLTVTLKTRYLVVKCKCDFNGEVIDFKCTPITATRI